jgi:hypothetical protein
MQATAKGKWFGFGQVKFGIAALGVAIALAIGAVTVSTINRDESIFPDGDVFNIQRSPNEHLAFGIGEHFCLGAGFARLELKVMFEELFRRFPDIEMDGPAERLRSTFIGGIKHLPVKLTPEVALSGLFELHRKGAGGG